MTRITYKKLKTALLILQDYTRVPVLVRLAGNQETIKEFERNAKPRTSFIHRNNKGWYCIAHRKSDGKIEQNTSFMPAKDLGCHLHADGWALTDDYRARIINVLEGNGK
jgi:hypothetical protein